MNTQNNTQRLAALLAWYREMGVTAALGDEPIDWCARGNAAPGATFVMPAPRTAGQLAGQQAGGLAGGLGRPATDTARAPVRAPLGNPSPAARETAPPATAPARPAPPQRSFSTPAPSRAPVPAPPAVNPVSAASLAELGNALNQFEGCGLKATAKSLCLFRGAETARVMIIGEAPGRDEDLAGKPFVGAAGQLLDRMLAAIGLDESTVHITNVVYWRPPGNRTPTPQEALACAPFLTRQIELVRPDVLLLLGGAAAKHMLATEDGIMKLRGKWRTIESAGRQIKTMATLHPAYVLRAPASKRQVWRDLLALKAVL
jgi:uracil-DNA glycosylase